MKNLKHLNKYFWKYKWRLLLGVIFLVFHNYFGALPAKLVKEATNELAFAVKNHSSFSPITIGLKIIGTALISGFFLFLVRQTIIVMSRFIEFDLKNEIYQHYQVLDLNFYRRNNTGDLMNRIADDVNKVRMYIGPAIMYLVNVAIKFAVIIPFMLEVSPKLTLYTLTPLPILSLSIYLVHNLIIRKSEKVQKQLSKLSTISQETFSGIRVLKSFAKESAFEKRFEEQCSDYKNKSMELVKVNALFMPAMLLLIGLSSLLTIYFGGIEAINGNISIGEIPEFIMYINMLTWPVASIGWVSSLIQRAEASQERINEFLHTKPDITSTNNSEQKISGTIELQNLTYTYPDSGITALKNVNLKIEEGKTLGIVGKTGSGKSTLANIICRFYDPTTGTILIDNKILTEYNLASIRSQIGYVPQESFLFSDTIGNNILFGVKTELTKQQKEEVIKKASSAAAVYSNISEFPGKFETMVGERGITLSGGQKQRISIARTLAGEHSILLFDDCLSAVDTKTEEEILSNLKKYSSNKTTLIISHRISTIKHANKIIVLDNGAIIEQGSHNDLIEKQGYYYSLNQKQLLEKQKEEV